MARRPIPQDETPEATIQRQFLETVANTATRSEKTSWDRKMDSMVSLLAKLRPIEEGILDLMAQKQPLIDQIQALRAEMVKTCVHPFTHLTYRDDGTARCSFCNEVFTVNNGKTAQP